jgi:phage-related protein
MLGDGYEMSVRFGLNIVRPEWQLTWETTAANATAIDAFLQARADAGESFDWRPPDGDSALPWYCDEWTVDHITFNWLRVNATFRQVFDYVPSEYLLQWDWNCIDWDIRNVAFSWL